MLFGSLAAVSLAVFTLAAREPLAARIAHTDPSKRQTVKAVHNGAGEIAYQVLLDSHSLDTNLYFVHGGVLQPKSSLATTSTTTAKKCMCCSTAKRNSRWTAGHRC